MPVVQDLSKAQIAFQLADGEPDQFLVLRYRGSEGLCRLYRFDIELASTQADVAFADVVGKPAVLSINTPGGPRWFHGIIGRFELIDETHDQNYYRAELVPAVWLLTHRYNSRIFQNKSVKDIVTEVLTKGGIASDRFQFTAERGNEPREYCVQYRETDYNFIARLLEEEGIWWTFQQTQEHHTLVMTDAKTYTPIEGDANLPFHRGTGLHTEADHVSRFRIGQVVRPGAVALNDFNYQNPKPDLNAKSDAGRDQKLEVYDYPGEYVVQGDGAKLAALRVEEFEASRTIGTGRSNCPRLSPGKKFALIEHASTPLNQEYLLTAITHQGKQSTTRTAAYQNGHSSVLDARVRQSLINAQRNDNTSIRELSEAISQIASRLQAGDPTAHRTLSQWLYHAGQVSKDATSVAGISGADPLSGLAVPNLLDDIAKDSGVNYDAPVYECSFECIPAALPFRPPRVTPWPVMRGTQTARVVGPSGEEIHTDEYGRVKVQFHWDREGNEGGQPKLYGADSSCWVRVSHGWAGGGYGMLFLPRVGQEVIVDFLEGNPDQPIVIGRVYNADHMPAYLPDQKTRSYIKTNSSKGGGGTNEIRFEDLKDSEQILLHAQKDLHVRVKNQRVETILADDHLTVAGNQIQLVKKNMDLQVKLDLSEKVGGKQSLDLTGDLGQKIGGNLGTDVTGSAYLKAASVVIEATGGITLKSGGNFVLIDAAGVTIMGTQVKINSGGSAGSGTAVAPKAPTDPGEADDVQPGKDTTYSGAVQTTEATPPGQAAGYEVPPEETKEKKTSWVEIELVDEAGMPVPGQRYRLTKPDGKKIEGSLNAMGMAHVMLEEPMVTQLTFPDLDADTWMRDAGPVPPAAGAAGVSPPPDAPAGQPASAPEEPLEEEDLSPDQQQQAGGPNEGHVDFSA